MSDKRISEGLKIEKKNLLAISIISCLLIKNCDWIETGKQRKLIEIKQRIFIQNIGLTWIGL